MLKSLVSITLIGSLTLPAYATTPAVAATPVAVVAPSCYPVELLESRFASWGVDPARPLTSINVKESWTKFKKNRDVIVAVIDTGIQADHPYLAENIYVRQGKKGAENYGMDFSTKTPNFKPIDIHGHGTHVAGIVKSVFPEVKILALKYYNPQASGQQNLESTVKALEYAVRMNVDITNYAGGEPET